MKGISFGIVLNCLLVNMCLGQNPNSGDFFELGIKTSKFIESSFLENSKYKGELSDPNTEQQGWIASPTGRNFSAKFRYGKRIFPKTFLISEFGFTRLNEQVRCFCTSLVCDKLDVTSTLVSLNAINIGIGTRYQVFNFNKFSFSFDLIGTYSFLTNEPGVKYFGYSVHPILGFEISKRLIINLKYGFEQSFNAYQKKEKYFELAINYSIK